MSDFECPGIALNGGNAVKSRKLHDGGTTDASGLRIESAQDAKRPQSTSPIHAPSRAPRR